MRITLLTSESEYVQRPLTVREPFSGPAAARHPLSLVADDLGLEQRFGLLLAVAPESRTVTTDGGDTIPYDALLLATGAVPQPRFKHVLNLDARRLDEQLRGLVQDVEAGMSKQLVFVAPREPSWPLPIYELALMTARRAYEMGVGGSVTVITGSAAPLSIFGSAASDAIEQELAHFRVALITGVEVEISDSGHLVINPGARELPADRIIVLPKLVGPTIPGISAVDENGFVLVDGHCAVQGIDRVYAAGDITSFPVKHGGIAAQQAEVAAEAIAALAGVELAPRALRPALRGIMFGGREPLYISARLEDGRAVDSQASTEPLWHSSEKLSTQYLASYLSELDDELEDESDTDAPDVV